MEVIVSKDRRSCALVCPSADLSAEKLSAAINALVEARARMEPAIPEEPIGQAHNIGDCSTLAMAENGLIVIGLFHPGIGWIRAQLTTFHARPVVERLAALLRMLPDPPRH